MEQLLFREIVPPKLVLNEVLPFKALKPENEEQEPKKDCSHTVIERVLSPVT